MGIQQDWIKCPSCGFKRALFDGDNYTRCWHCDICGYRKSEPGDELWYETKNDRSAWAHVHSECGRDVTPKETILVKAKRLSKLMNAIILFWGEPLYSLVENILPFLRYKYKITNKYSANPELPLEKQIVEAIFEEEQ